MDRQIDNRHLLHTYNFLTIFIVILYYCYILFPVPVLIMQCTNKRSETSKNYPSNKSIKERTIRQGHQLSYTATSCLALERHSSPFSLSAPQGSDLIETFRGGGRALLLPREASLEVFNKIDGWMDGWRPRDGSSQLLKAFVFYDNLKTWSQNQPTTNRPAGPTDKQTRSEQTFQCLENLDSYNLSDRTSAVTSYTLTLTFALSH